MTSWKILAIMDIISDVGVEGIIEMLIIDHQFDLVGLAIFPIAKSCLIFQRR